MDTKDKERQLSASEKRRRMEARKKRQKKQRQKRMIRLGLLICAGILILALLIFGGMTVFKLVTGKSSASDRIKPRKETVSVVIDAGHGGEDIGQSSESVTESEVTMRICAKLKIMLESQGYTVTMTRPDDTRVSKEDRIAIANESEADLLVSVHCGFSDDEEKTGAMTHYEDKNKQSRYLAEQVQAALVKESSAKDGGISAGEYSIVNDTDMPAVLVEVGYLSNGEEALNLADDVYRNLTAKGIAKGIIKSLANE